MKTVNKDTIKELQERLDAYGKWWEDYNTREGYVCANISYDVMKVLMDAEDLYKWFRERYPMIADELIELWPEDRIQEEIDWYIESENDYLTEWLDGCATEEGSEEWDDLNILAEFMDTGKRHNMFGETVYAPNWDSRFGSSGKWLPLLKESLIEDCLNDAQYQIDEAEYATTFGSPQEAQDRLIDASDIMGRVDRAFEAFDRISEYVSRMAKGLNALDYFQNGCCRLDDEIAELYQAMQKKNTIGVVGK